MDINKKKKITALVFGLCIIAVCQASNEENIPRGILFFGRLHPLILHLPIGALILTFFIDIIGRLKKEYPKTVITNALGFSALLSIITVIFGYFLSLEGGYEEQILDIHFWTGILSACCIIVLFYLSYKQYDKFVLPLFIVSLLSISVAGHYGSVLTHGDDFVTEYAFAPPEKRTIEVIDSLKIYEDVVFRILDKKCLQCHNSTKKKGELSLLTKASILKGGENGKIITKNNAFESDLYMHPILPIADEKHMPPEGKPQLSKNELWLLKYWIENGASFENYIAKMPKNDTLKKALKKYLVFNEKEIEEASSKDVAEVISAGFSVMKRVPGEAGLHVKFLKDTITNKEIKALINLKDQIVELNLSNSGITDKMTSSLKKMKNLEVLRLDNTNITDESLKYIETLEFLKSLNLYQTNVSNIGLKNLLKSVSPAQIFVWKTKVDTSFSKELEKEYGIQIHNGMFKGFVELSPIKKPSSKPDKTLFTKDIDITLLSELKKVDLRYTTDGKEPDSLSTLYTIPVHINKTTNLKIKAFKKGWLPSETLDKYYFKIGHKIVNYSIKQKPDIKYPGAHKLFDLEEGSTSFKDGKWTGYLGFDVNTIIDLGSVKSVDNISVNCLENVGNWIVFPEKMIAYTSKDGKTNFKKIGEIKIKRKDDSKADLKKRFTLSIPKTTAQYFKVVIKNPKVLPKWHEGAGKASWIFVDEIFLW